VCQSVDLQTMFISKDRNQLKLIWKIFNDENKNIVSIKIHAMPKSLDGFSFFDDCFLEF